MKIRTRFAPSPTGFLHIGGARTALFNWLFARHHKGTFVLRIEDTDEARSTDDSVQAILDSIRWMGLDWDEGPVDGKSSQGSYAPYFQMQRLEIYREFVLKLLADGKAYPCYCTKEELDEMRRLAALEKRPPRYEGRCRALSDKQKQDYEAEGKKYSIRFKMPDNGNTVVEDLIRGFVSFENHLLQDFVMVKTSGVPTYNFACVIDDHLMEISHVIRGDEHLSNTPSQLRLYEALGWAPPLFAHLSMILGPDGAKLSKRHGATSVLEYRDQGYLPEALRNYLALLGWATKNSQDLFTPDELIASFDLGGCQKNPATFDTAKLNWMNGEYIRKMPASDLIRVARPFLDAAKIPPSDSGPSLETVVALEHQKYKKLTDIPSLIDFFYKPLEITQKAREQSLAGPEVLKILEGLIKRLEALESFTEKEIEACVRLYCGDNGFKPSQVFHPLRAAVSGRTDGPTLFLMLEIMGQLEVVGRLRSALEVLEPI
jgi:glutamyl-tRNA synthetase